MISFTIIRLKLVSTTNERIQQIIKSIITTRNELLLGVICGNKM